MATKPTSFVSKFVKHKDEDGKSRSVECVSCGKIWTTLSKKKYLKWHFGISMNKFPQKLRLLPQVQHIDRATAGFELLIRLKTHICFKDPKSKIIDIQISNLIEEFNNENQEFRLKKIDANTFRIGDLKQVIHYKYKYKYPIQQILIYKLRENEYILMNNDSTLKEEEIKDEEDLFWALDLESQ